ncbi:MAG TPA: hypothetical protein VMG10_01720 [Gemmataceae bacterium]|nr:hypothetical protein [Gemmataceae bacterium]
MTAQPKPVDLKALLDKIEKIAPSSPEIAKDLLKEFQTYSAHLREMDRKALQAQIVVTYLGQVFGLVIGMTAIICGALTAYHGSQWAGGFIGGGGVIGLVSVFVLGRRKGS